jgi:hypothetical protein
VPYPRSQGQLLECVEELIFELVGGIFIVERDEIPDVLQVLQRIGGEHIRGHLPLLYASAPPESHPGLRSWNTEAAIQLFDSAVDFLAHFGKAVPFELFVLFQKPQAFADYFRGRRIAPALYLVIDHLFQFGG